MSVTISTKTVPITTSPKVGGVAPPYATSTGGVPRSTGPQREQAARAGEKIDEDILVLSLGDYIPLSLRVPPETYEPLERLGRRDPLATSLASMVVCSECPSSSFLVPPGRILLEDGR